MTFKVIDRKTGKEPTSRVIDNIAKKGGLMTMDIDQFFVGEDGSLVLADDYGNITYCDTKRFKVTVEQELKTDSEIIRDESVEKILDELEEEFVKIDIPIMDKLTLFAKITNAIYKFAEQDLTKI